MPTFEVVSPDGRKFRVDAPEGATQADAIAYVQSQQKATAKPEAESPRVSVAGMELPDSIGAGVIGAGRQIDRLMQGVKQPFLGEAAAAAQKQTQDENTRIYGGLQEKHPIATTVGEIAPLIAALPAVGGVGSAAALGAIPGALEYGTAEERGQRGAMGALGGALGAGVGKAIGRIAQPFRNAPTESQAAAQAAAERLGVQLRPDEVTGSRPLKWATAALNDMPFAGGMAQKAERGRTEAINAAGARSIGQQATDLTTDVLAQARTDIGGVFDNILSNRQITLGPKFRTAVQKISDSKVMPALRDESTEKIIAPFQNMPKGTIKVTGEWFQQNKTALDQEIRAAYNNSQPGRAMALEKFEDALVDAAKDSMNATERAAFTAAQKQWASLRLLETGKVVEGGNVMPGRLDQALISRYKGAYKEGKIKGELADIGTLSQAYKPMPQSGTAPRAFYTGLASGAGLMHPGMTAAALAAPPLAQKFMQSDAGRHYLTKGLANITPEIEKRLMQGGYGLLGLPIGASVE